jgi:hypothetical protein
MVYHQRDGLKGLPIAVADAVIDLLDPHIVGVIVNTVRFAENRFGTAVGLVVIDTYAKGIAASGGDEDKARDHNRAAANLRKVHAEIDVHIALVGHTGKDESRGARGSNAHIGDVDEMVQITGVATKIARVIKGNDQPERELTRFTLEVFELGRDSDGDAITTAIVSTEHHDTFADCSEIAASKVKLSPKAHAALRALHECMTDETPPPPNEDVSAGAKSVPLDIWRDRLLSLAIINAKGNPREEFRRIHATLKSRGMIDIVQGVVWPVT